MREHINCEYPKSRDQKDIKFKSAHCGYQNQEIGIMGITTQNISAQGT